EAEDWTRNDGTGLFKTTPIATHRTRKVQKPIVLYDATKEHPAQTQLVTENVTVGHWTTTKFASVMSAAEKRTIVERIHKLQEAVKVAREEANSAEVPQVKIAANVLSYV